MATHQDIHQARQNGSGIGQVPGALPINSERVVQLLVEGSQPGRHFAVRRNSNALLEQMGRQRWIVSAGIHEGGFGDARGADWTSHITVSFGPGRKYHLRLDARGQLFQVSGPGLVDFDPNAPPGEPAVKPR